MSLKKRLGFKEKPKTRKEVQKAYIDAAYELGHNLRLLADFQEEIERLEERNKELLLACRKANLEAKHAIPDEEPKEESHEQEPNA